MEFNEIIKSRRLKLNKTLEEIAYSCNVSKATVQRWESGEIKNVRRDKIANLATALNITPAYLMGWDEQEKSSMTPFGTENEIKEFLKDEPELWNTFKKVYSSDTLRILLDGAKDLSPEDLKPILMIINGIRKEKGLD